MTETQRVKKVINWLVFMEYAENERELAEKLGYTKSSFSQIVNGKVPLSERFVQKLASVDRNINKVFDMDRGSGLEYCLLFNQINRRTTAKIFFRYTTTIIASTIQKPLICVCCHHVNSRSTGTAFSTILSLYTRLSR